MANQEVPKLNTPVSEAQLTRALLDAARELFGLELTKPQLAILIAQNNLETGNRKFMWNFNIGNITHSNSDSFDYFIGGDKTKDKQGNWIPTQHKFRAYPTLQDGARDYLRTIKFRANGKVWETILKADPVAFSKILKSTKYYEADEKDYTKGLLSAVKSYNNKDSYEKAVSGNTSPIQQQPKKSVLNQIDTLLDQFLKAVAQLQDNKFRK